MLMFKKMFRQITATALIVAFALTLATPFASAKTNPAGQTVGTVLFYITNASGEEILVSQIPVTEMESDMANGNINDTLHNYSLLDKFTTTVHQEAQGFTVPEFIEYAQTKSTVDALRALPFTFAGADKVSFWEIDQTSYDDMDTYTYGDLYSVPRYNFPLLYEYWDYDTQDYYDPAGKMSREQVIDHIFSNGQPETMLLSVRAFSQRYMVTDEKFRIDYNMENYWHNQGFMDNQRTIRVMLPMTKDNLYNKQPTASDTRYWTANIRLNMAVAPSVASLGTVAAPTAVMTESGDNYYVRLSCATDDATILYNHNFISPSYTPTSPYADGAVIIPKEYFKSGEVTMTARAVKEGYSDTGVVTLKLKSSGTEQNPEAATATWLDVPDGEWYFEAVNYVMDKKLFDETGKSTFGVTAPMTRAMFATALYRLDGKPEVSKYAAFSDVTTGTPLSEAVSWAVDAGVTNGTGNGSTFSPDASITRQDIAAMLFRYHTYKYGEETVLHYSKFDTFPDVGSISDYAATALRWTVNEGIINGTTSASGDILDPKGTATRAQVAQIIYKYAQ